MLLKIVGSLIVLAAATAAGFVASNSFVERIRQLRELQYALRALEAEILYTETPLANAFAAVAGKCDGAVKMLFGFISEQLAGKQVSSVNAAFAMAIGASKKVMHLDKEEIEVLSSFMISLGGTDLEGQKKNFNITMKKLELLEQKAEEARSKNESMYKYLGLCSGVLIVIFLV